MLRTNTGNTHSKKSGRPVFPGNRPLDAVLSALVQTLQPPEGDHSRNRSHLDGTADSASINAAADAASINAADGPAKVAAAGKGKGKREKEKAWELPRCEFFRSFHIRSRLLSA